MFGYWNSIYLSVKANTSHASAMKESSLVIDFLPWTHMQSMFPLDKLSDQKHSGHRALSTCNTFRILLSPLRHVKLCVAVRKKPWRRTSSFYNHTGKQQENDMRNISYSGGQPVKWVMKYILQQDITKEQITKVTVAFFPSAANIKWRKKKKKIHKALHWVGVLYDTSKTLLSFHCFMCKVQVHGRNYNTNTACVHRILNNQDGVGHVNTQNQTALLNFRSGGGKRLSAVSHDLQHLPLLKLLQGWTREIGKNTRGYIVK